MVLNVIGWYCVVVDGIEWYRESPKALRVLSLLHARFFLEEQPPPDHFWGYQSLNKL